MQILRYSALFLAIVALMLQFYYRIVTARENNRAFNIRRSSLFRGLLGALLLGTLAYTVFATELSRVPQIIGLILVITGLCLRIWAQLSLGKYWSVDVSVYLNHRLVTGGPYRFLRHPMYAALGLCAFAHLMISPNLSLLALWCFYLLLLFQRALMESAALDRHFEKQFRVFTTQPTMIFPPVYLMLADIFRGTV